MEREVDLFYKGAHRVDIPKRTDLGHIIAYNDASNKRCLYAQGFPGNEDAARDGGKVAGDARIALEKKTGRKIVSKDNFLGTRDQSILNV